MAAAPAEATPRGDDAVWGLLDGKGYVRLLDCLGTDLTVVNAARASFVRESRRFGPSDERLLRFLCRRKELHPFRHAALSFEVHAPLVTARQWWRYTAGSAHLSDHLHRGQRAHRLGLLLGSRAPVYAPRDAGGRVRSPRGTAGHRPL